MKDLVDAEDASTVHVATSQKDVTSLVVDSQAEASLVVDSQAGASLEAASPVIKCI